MTDQNTHEHTFQRRHIGPSAQETEDMLSAIGAASMDQLMGDNLVSKRSIEIRERIVLPLITVQQFAIQQMLESGQPDENLQRLILRSMFGIINAARNAA